MDIAYIFLLAAFIFAIYFVLNLRKKKNLELEHDNLLLQRKMALEYYQSIKEHMELAQKFRDEIAGHMRMIEDIVRKADTYSKETKEYVDSLRRQYEKLCASEYCDSFILDMGISRKVTGCRLSGIETVVDLKDFSMERFQEEDYLRILSSLLDFAAARCMEVKKPEKRFINLVCRTEADGDTISLVCAKKGSLRKKKLHMLMKGMGLSELLEEYRAKTDFLEKGERLEMLVHVPSHDGLGQKTE